MSEVETEYKETRAGPKKLKIPEEWNVRNLGELVSRLTNGISESQSSDDTGFPVTRIETIAQGWVNHDKVGYVDANKSEYSDYRLEEEDVLFSHINSIPHIGKTAQYEGEEELYHGMNLLLIRFDEEEIEQEYGYIYLNSKLARDFWVSNCKQAVNQASLNQGEVESLPFIIPSRAEQRRIAEILSTVDEAIRQTDEIIETSKELKKGLMQDLLTKKPNSYDSPTSYGEVPDNWEIQTIKNLSEKVTDGSHNPPSRVDDGVPILSSQNIRNGRIDFSKDPSYISEKDFEDMSRNIDLKEDDVLLTVVGTLGRSVRLEKDHRFAIQRSIGLIRPDKEKIDSEYLRYVTNSPDFQRQMDVRSKATAQSGLYLEELRQIKIPIPPLDEQKDIAEKLSTVDEKILQEEEYREKLEDLKRGLMQDLLTGKVRVEPEEA